MEKLISAIWRPVGTKRNEVVPLFLSVPLEVETFSHLIRTNFCFFVFAPCFVCTILRNVAG